MTKHLQTRLHLGDKPKERGNCLAACLACFFDEKSPEDVPQFQECDDSWFTELVKYVDSKGYMFNYPETHPMDDSFYFVVGESPRDSNIKHIVIYQNGGLYHDTHPDGTGVVSELHIEQLIKV